MLFHPSGAYGPDLPWFQGITTYAVFALQFWCGYKLLNTILPNGIAKMGVSELCSADTFLLFFYSASGLHGNSNGPFKVFIRDYRFGSGI